MGVIDIGDLRRSAVVDESLHDAGNQRALDTRDQFAVAEGACPAFAVADIAVGVKFAVAPVTADLQHAPVGARAALEKDGTDAVSEKSPSREESGWTRAKNERGRPLPINPGEVGESADGLLSLQINFQGIDPGQFMPLSGVEASLEDAYLADLGRLESEGLGHQEF